MTTRYGELTISEVAAATGLSVHTLRYYERIGLISPVGRAGNSHRRYSEDDIGWIGFLLKLRATGMSIQDMQSYAALQRRGDATLPERVAMLKQLQCQAEARIDELNEHLGLIRYKVAFYSEQLAEATGEASPAAGTSRAATAPMGQP